jgi:hypothetical protein
MALERTDPNAEHGDLLMAHRVRDEPFVSGEETFDFGGPVGKEEIRSLRGWARADVAVLADAKQIHDLSGDSLAEPAPEQRVELGEYELRDDEQPNRVHDVTGGLWCARHTCAGSAKAAVRIAVSATPPAAPASHCPTDG